ncbi:MAG: hypothetical protein IKW28_07430 [Lachnospiraceae bacterium]|nr:hypothetical protein [Lachnospiraceae bacterium]
MITNLADYFLPEQEFYLQSIVYDRIENTIDSKHHTLNCLDNISVDTNDETVKITVTRTLKFEPKELFSLTVSFGAILKFNPQNKSEYKWREINLAEEFRYNGDFVIGNLMQRITLQIAQITSSFGQTPIILPPNISKK